MEVFKPEPVYTSTAMTAVNTQHKNDSISIQAFQIPNCKSAVKQENDLNLRQPIHLTCSEMLTANKPTDLTISPVSYDPHNLQPLKLAQMTMQDSLVRTVPVALPNGSITHEVEHAVNVGTKAISGSIRPGKRPAPSSPFHLADCKFGEDLSNSGSDGEGQDNSSTADVEGVWSVDIEQCFQEALAIYPPCGRRKIILSEEGKMYGRNELIARYIYQHTGKIRSRKQVSSHIQVLARRRSKELQAQIKDPDTKQRAIMQLSMLSSAQIVSASVLGSKPLSGTPVITSGSKTTSPPSVNSSTTTANSARIVALNGRFNDAKSDREHSSAVEPVYSTSPSRLSTPRRIPLEQLVQRSNLPCNNNNVELRQCLSSKNGFDAPKSFLNSSTGLTDMRNLKNDTSNILSNVSANFNAPSCMPQLVTAGGSVGPLSTSPATAMALAAAQVAAAAAYGQQAANEAACGQLWPRTTLLGQPSNIAVSSSGTTIMSICEQQQKLPQVTDASSTSDVIQRNLRLTSMTQRPTRNGTTDLPYAPLHILPSQLMHTQQAVQARLQAQSLGQSLPENLAYHSITLQLENGQQRQHNMVNLSDVDPSALLQPHYADLSMATLAATRFLPNQFNLPWTDRSIASPKMRLVELSAFMISKTRDLLHATTDHTGGSQHQFVHISPTKTPSYTDPLLEQVDASQIWDKFPEDSLKELIEHGPANTFFLVKFWADVNVQVEPESTFAVSVIFEGVEDVPLNLSTKVCSFGKQVVEKIQQVEQPRSENGQYVYRFLRSPMCDYMKSFIGKLLQLPHRDMMNSVLENFTILHILTNKFTNELLLCIAYVLEVAQEGCGAQHHIYKLTRCS